MKFFWGVVVIVWLLVTAAKADGIIQPSEDKWIDSIYQELTINEHVGQLIDLRIEPDDGNIDDLIGLICKYHIGSITITGGSLEASIKLINTIRSEQKVPIFISVENHESLGLPFRDIFHLPTFHTYAKANDLQLLSASIDLVSGIYQDLGITGCTYAPNAIRLGDYGLEISNEYGVDEHLFYQDLAAHYIRRGLVPGKDIYFNFLDDFRSATKARNELNSTDWEQKKNENSHEWEFFGFPQSIINIKSFSDLKDDDAVIFSRRITRPLFEKHLAYQGILSSDFDAIRARQYQNSDEEIIKASFKIGADKIVISTKADMVFNSMISNLNNQYFKRSEIREKVKRILKLKYRSIPSNTRQIDYNQLFSKVNSPELLNVSYQVYSKAYEIADNGKKLMPFPDLESTNFASLVLGFSEFKTFQETLGKYAPFVHYMLPDISFDPFDLKILSDQLAQFDNVIVGLHTAGLLELDQSVLKFLDYLNQHTNVIVVILGKSVSSDDLDTFENILYMHEDNMFTQQIAAQAIFTQGGEGEALARLSYSRPEMQHMDSRVLNKIDQIVEEAIKMGATPGCQVLVARNGSVVLEKGYGYYTYDSIMPVDTRTIYDLASITKVAATTQAIMKLNEQGIINLDSAIGTYLPELRGSNKSSLVIRDILSHQSGLKAFYPFWRNTIEDEDQILYYYKDKPNEIHNKTVAYGMFAAENLKDSLWNWTVDMDLREKSDIFQSYDYKYSDLGFYLLQVLVERISDTSLDTFVDSVFYNSMGMSTLTFNPLCKFPIKRIAPTERDYEFRQVLVWGTVHDQIAAMKGGVSGHAGLFGNSHDIAKLMQMQLQLGSYGGKRYLEEETVKEFTAQQYKENRRGLGWDKPEKGDDYNPASRYASFKSFGHSGFTGTVVWADPTFDLIFVFLSNRVYPDSNNSKLVEFNVRERIHDVVYESIWNFEKFYH